MARPGYLVDTEHYHNLLIEELAPEHAGSYRCSVTPIGQVYVQSAILAVVGKLIR